MAELSLHTTRKELFGSLDALDEEDNVFKEYFVHTNVFEKMRGAEKILILVGEKGTGKSAIMKMCMITDKANGICVVNIQRPQVQEDLDINSKVNMWKDYLAGEIVTSLRGEIAIEKGKFGKLIGIVEELANEYIHAKYHIDYKKVKTEILDVFLNSTSVNIYIDDLDNGYRGTVGQNESIIALFTAIREMVRENNKLKFRVTLRADVYDNVRCVDESSDKIQDARVNLLLTNHQILAMLTKRVMKFLGGNPKEDYSCVTQKKMIEYMQPLFVPRFQGKGMWQDRPIYNILIALTRRRPRDLFVLCGLAWNHAVENNRTRIESEDLEAIFNDYSNERLKDAIAEYHHEFRGENDLRDLILALKPSARQKKEHDYRPHIYTRDNLVKKIKSITGRKNIYWQSQKMATDVELVRFLYKSNIVVGRIDTDNEIKRIYYIEKPNLVSELVDAKYRLEVHPAYRWAIDVLDENILKTVDFEAGD